MKTKRIVALALTAAMALSMSMTAFAAAGTWANYKISSYDEDSHTTTNAWGIRYKVAGKDPHVYYFQEAEKVVSAGEVDSVMGISQATQDAKGNTAADVPFSKIKGNLEVPANDPESSAKFYGWSTNPQGDKVYTKNEADDAKKEAIADDFNVAGLDDAKNQDKNGVVTFYPVMIEKSMEDKVKDAQEIAARPKIAKTKDDKDWKYTAQEICAVKSKEKASSDEGKSDCEKCNTTTGKAVVFDVKPVVRESGKEVILRTSKAPKVEVILPITRVLTKDEKAKLTSEDEAKKIVDQLKKDIKENKDNQVKVFHIGSDGKSHPVTNFEIVYAAPTGVTDSSAKEVCVKFTYGSFSDFVVTRDKNAKAQAGEEEGASGGNPATGEASALPVAMLALAALSATGVVAYKKRKAE